MSKQIKIAISVIAISLLVILISGLLLISATIFPKQLISSGKDYIPYISPNSIYIAFLSKRNTYNPNVAGISSELWLMNKDGSEQHPLILIGDLDDGPINVKKVSWSKKSDDMLVQISTRHRSEIWRVTLNGAKTRLSSTNDWTERPEYSPDGSKIAYMIQEPSLPLVSPVFRLYVSNTDFSEPVLIEKGLIQDFVWQSDSNELIYSLYNRPNENFELWKYSISGNKKLQFSNMPANERHFSCSSDGKYIAYSAQNKVYVTGADTFQAKKVIDNARIPKWIPNRNLLLIFSEQTLDNESFWTESWIVDLDGNIIKKIGKGKSTMVNFSADGEYFVYSLDGNIWIDKFRK